MKFDIGEFSNMIVEKIFTKKEKNNIMVKKYNPLNKDEGFYEREGLFMRETEELVLDEVMEGANFIRRIILKVFKKDFIKVYKKGVKEGFNWSDNTVR